MFRSDPLVRSRREGRRKETNSLDLQRRQPVALPYTLGIAEVSYLCIADRKALPSPDAAQIENWALTGAGIATDWPKE
jgi:hypothetical protein